MITAVAVLAIDQVTKSIALARLHRPVHLFGPFGFNLTFNSGTGFSLFTGPVGVIVVVVVAVIVLIGVVAWRSTTTRLSIVLGLIVGGALGNLSDRLFRGHHGAVVDFITLTHWPTFNVADSSITIGAVLVVVFSLLRPKLATPT